MRLNFGLLTTENSPMNEPLIAALSAAGATPTAIYVDGKLGPKDVDIVKSRMPKGYSLKSIYDLETKGINIISTKNHNSEECLQSIKDKGIVYLGNAGTPRILKSPILNSCRGILNCHPGILPNYRGCSAVEWSIFNDDPVGATVHFMSEGIDEGPILLTEVLSVKAFESYESIRYRMNELQCKLLAQAFSQLMSSGKSPQDFTQQKEGQYYKPITEEKYQLVKDKLSTGRYKC